MQRRPLTRLVAFAIVAWTVVGVASFLARWGAARLQAQPVGLAWLFASVFLSVWLWAAFTPAIVWAAARWPVLGRSRRAAHYGIHALVLVSLTVVEAAAYGGAEQLLRPANPTSFGVRFLALFTLVLVSYAVIAAAGTRTSSSTSWRPSAPTPRSSRRRAQIHASAPPPRLGEGQRGTSGERACDAHGNANPLPQPPQ